MQYGVHVRLIKQLGKNVLKRPQKVMIYHSLF